MRYVFKAIPVPAVPGSPVVLTVEGEGDTPLLAMGDAYVRAAEEEITRARGRHARPEAATAWQQEQASIWQQVHARVGDGDDGDDTDGRDAGGFDVSGLGPGFTVLP